MNRLTCFGASVLAAAFLAGPAFGQPVPLPPFCGATGTLPVIKPIIRGAVVNRDDPNFGCHLWQTFVYLNWPAKAGRRGVPDPSKQFGAPGTTVWETYPTVEQTFLPGAQDPGPWEGRRVVGAAVPQGFAERVVDGSLRALSRESKISREVIANLGSAATDPDILSRITQAFGGVLYDQNRKPVYYEIAMNEDQYNYIRQNGLYNADTQLAFAIKQTIALPMGDGDGTPGAIELKAAWKILGPKDDKSKFHTAQAIVVRTWAQPQPITVGLVGLHIVQTVRNMPQAVWGTFAHVDNAPLDGQFGKGPYNFYNPGCRPLVCPPNSKITIPTQVVQLYPDAADIVNQNMKTLILKHNPASVWQHYKLLAVQWPRDPVALKVPALRPLPDGNPGLPILTNPVLETFVQSNGNCLGCHIFARVADPRPNVSDLVAPQNGSSYSFMFSYADVPRK
ncbi:MAG: hypothetical protein WCE79_24795 [Xanthobacteraceae bacterium]